MGVMALSVFAQVRGHSVLLDMGGTTTDIALYAAASPVLARDGMQLPLEGGMHKTQTRSLATLSIGIGGDSPIPVRGEGNGGEVRAGPRVDG